MWAKCLQRSYIAGHTAAICDVDSHHTITRSFLQFCFDEFLLFWTDEFWDRRDLMYLQTTGATVNANFDKFFMWSVGKLTSVSINMNTKCLHHPLSIILVTLSLHGLHTPKGVVVCSVIFRSQNLQIKLKVFNQSPLWPIYSHSPFVLTKMITFCVFLKFMCADISRKSLSIDCFPRIEYAIYLSLSLYLYRLWSGQ